MSAATRRWPSCASPSTWWPPARTLPGATPGTPLTCRRAPGAAGALGGQRRLPASRQRRRHRFADIRDTRNRLAISPSPAPASINSAAASRTCSRRARSAAVSPPPSGYLMAPAYPARQPSPEPVTPAFKIVSSPAAARFMTSSSKLIALVRCHRYDAWRSRSFNSASTSMWALSSPAGTIWYVRRRKSETSLAGASKCA